MYNTYKYIQICTNLDHYIKYIHLSINTCNTCQLCSQYTLININADKYLSYNMQRTQIGHTTGLDHVIFTPINLFYICMR